MLALLLRVVYTCGSISVMFLSLLLDLVRLSKLALTPPLNRDARTKMKIAPNLSSGLYLDEQRRRTE